MRATSIVRMNATPGKVWMHHTGNESTHNVKPIDRPNTIAGRLIFTRLGKHARHIYRAHERHAGEGLDILDESLQHSQASGSADGVRVHGEGE